MTGCRDFVWAEWGEGFKGPVINYGDGVGATRWEGSQEKFQHCKRGADNILAMLKVGGGGANCFEVVLT